MKVEDCAIVVLASGLSKRFGSEDKLLTPFLGKPLCTHIINTLAPIPFAHRYAVLPDNTPERTAYFLNAGYQIITNPHPEQGRGYALMLAARALLAQDMPTHMCITLADMPLIKTSHFQTLLTHANTPLTMSENKTIKMPPILFARTLLNALSKTTEARKTIIATAQTQTVALSGFSACDIDTKTDLRALENLLTS